MAKEIKRYLFFKNGDKKEIIGENGKYWLCDGAQYGKSNTSIAKIVEEKVEKETKAVEKETKSKPKSKSKKAKKEFDEGFDQIPDVSDLM